MRFDSWFLQAYNLTMGLSVWHLLVVLLIVMVFFGPSRLENMGSSLGKAIRGFKKGLEGDEEEKKKKDQEKDGDKT